MLSRYIRSLHTFEATISYSMDGIDALPISLFVFSHYSIFEPVRTICSRSTVPLSSPLPLSPCAKVFLAENSKVPFTPLLFMVVVVPLCLLVCRFSFSISTTHFFYWFKSFCIFRIFFQQFGVLSSPLTHSRSRFHFLYIPHSLALELLVEVEVCKLFLYIVTISVCRRRYRRVCCMCVYGNCVPRVANTKAFRSTSFAQHLTHFSLCLQHRITQSLLRFALCFFLCCAVYLAQDCCYTAHFTVYYTVRHFPGL